MLKKLLKAALFLMVIAITLPLLALAWMHWQYQAPEIRRAMTGPSNFDAKALVAVSDVDQWATAYADKQLSPLPNAEDELAIIDVSGESPAVVSRVAASNSVIGWPQTVAVHPEGQFAYVGDVRGQPDKSLQSVPNSVYYDMPTGGELTTIRLGDNAGVVDRRTVAQNANSVTVSPDGQWLAVASDQPGEELVLMRLVDGLPTERIAVSAGVDFGDYARQGLRGLFWHPSSRYLAGNISDHGVAFWKLETTGETRVVPVGKLLSFGETLTVGEFHPSGKYLFMADVAWGSNSKPADFILNKPGFIHVVEFSETGEHKLADSIEVGRSPEGMALSPDGSRLVAVNMERTYLPNGIPATWIPGRDANSLSLIAFDAANGKGTVLDTAGFDGLLPEDAVFDADGDALAVAIFHHRDQHVGVVDFWRIEADQLVLTSHSVELARGAHDLVIVR